jgi:cell division protein FtsI/penicillin-binding protein 2
MVALKPIPWLLFLCLLPLSSSGDNVPAHGPAHGDLFAQSAVQALSRDFRRPEVSFLLLDAQSGELLASRWEYPATPIPMGSLVKPFTALAYGEQYGFAFPSYECRGTASGCWRPRGHGRLNLESAIAHSCNAYFAMLAARLNVHQLSLVTTQFDLEPPADNASPAAFAGIGREWTISPLRLARAYLELARRRDQPGVRDIINGMALSARLGTGAAVGRALPQSPALVKTGTAPCTHAKRAPGDGFALAMWPVDAPRILLLVRAHGMPGAEAAATVGEMLRRIAR